MRNLSGPIRDASSRLQRRDLALPDGDTRDRLRSHATACVCLSPSLVSRRRYPHPLPSFPLYIHRRRDGARISDSERSAPAERSARSRDISRAWMIRALTTRPLQREGRAEKGDRKLDEPES